MWVSPHHPPAERRAEAAKQTGRRTVRPDRVVFGGWVGAAGLVGAHRFGLLGCWCRVESLPIRRQASLG
jgi:hypothetical protein